MATFTYIARTRDGRKERGTLSADNRQALVRALQSRGLTPERVQEQTAGKLAAQVKDPRVKSKEILVFTRQLSTIVNSGLPLLSGLDILAEQTEDERFAAVLQDISSDVEAGATFSGTLAKHSKIFPPIYVSMVRAGEASGNLDSVLLRLAEHLEAGAELKRRIKSAMTYPVVALSMILLIATALIIWVVPQFATIFESFGHELPAPTQLLINTSNALRAYWYVVIGAIAAIVLAFRVYAQTKGGRLQLDRLKLKLPIFGKLLRKVAISRFASTLSTLTRSGVNILAALEIVEQTSGNEVFARVIQGAGDSVRSGQTLADPLARSGEFPGMVTRMIEVGEKTGALEQMLQKIADFYDSEVKAAVDALTSMIEPLLILFMGIVVGGIVIALFMPILQLSSLVGQ